MRPVQCTECEKTNLSYFILEGGDGTPMVLGPSEARMAMCSRGHLIVWKAREEGT